MPSVSPAQLTALRLIAAGGVTVREGRIGRGWTVSGPQGRLNARTVGVLATAGLVDRDTRTSLYQGQALNVTDAGRAALTEAAPPRPTVTVDAETAARVVHHFAGGLAEVIAPRMACVELKALLALLAELGTAPNLLDYWAHQHEAEGTCDDCADPDGEE